MKRQLRRLLTFVFAMTVAISAVPISAHAARPAPVTVDGDGTVASGVKAGSRGVNALGWGSARYQNFGNPGWCLDNNGVRVYIDPCNGGPYQLWFYTRGADDLQLVSNVYYPPTPQGNLMCLAGYSGPLGTYVEMHLCDPNDPTQIWDVWAVNGHVVFQRNNSSMCLQPNGTALVLRTCDRTNVPNERAWDYYRTPSDPVGV